MTGTETVEAQIAADRLRWLCTLSERELVKMAERWEAENAPSAWAANHRGAGGVNWAREALRALAAAKAA